ncbi:MAG TPA: plasmid pRiA4b ORF-3 family protein, partial [Acidimicrobiales bacterium]|nr:plasmid pRiA4b ORF-3 family protein [Acidimicrobiales bacterium]
MPTPPGQVSFQLRIQLEDVKPVVWRRLLVPGNVRLSKLHDMFQAAMGWTNSHLHSFTVGEECYGSL